MSETKTSICWEAAGLCVGFGVVLLLITQCLTDIFNPAPSTASLVYLIGFLCVHIFWTTYGVINGRLAIWVSNLACGCVQICWVTSVLLGC